MANLYYNPAIDTAWDTLGNWWTNATFTVPATALPATGDTVYLAALMDYGPSVSVTLNHIYVADASTGGGSFYVAFTGAIGDATFNDGSDNNGTVTGDATFNDFSYNSYYATVSGNATFNDGSYNYGTVSGNATFNDSSSYNYGTVSGNATFNDFSYNYEGTVTGNATFNDSSRNKGTISGNATFNDSSTNYYGTVSGNATFNDSSRNKGTISGNAAFFDSSENNGTVYGDLYVHGMYYIGEQPTAILYFTNTSGNGLWRTLSNWQNHNGDSPKEAPWTGRLTALVNLELSSGAPVPQLDGLLLGTKRDIAAVCNNQIAEEIVTNGENIISALNLI